MNNNGSGTRTSVLRAVFVNTGMGTVLADKYHTSPIKIAKSFPLSDQLAIIIMDVSPGLLNGDRYELEWFAGKETYSFITNQSYTKVHPSLLDGKSSMLQSFTLEEKAIIEHMPEPIMLFKDAQFHNDTTVQLAAGAVWMQADVLCPGRTFRDEVFEYREFRNSLSIYYEDELIFTQRQRIVPATQSMTAPGCWDDMTHWASFYVFSDRVTSALLETVKLLLDELPEFQHHQVEAGASLTHRYGIVVSAASTAAWPLQQTMRLVWGCIREALFGKPPLLFLKQ
ncbi:MAG: urease accessory protein UreD [Candidatus Pristimantibacillus sp.]